MPSIRSQSLDQEAYDHLLKCDPKLARIITVVGSPQLRSDPQGFPALVDAIVSQQISTKAADAILRRLQSALGELSPEVILSHTPESLRELGLSRQKGTYLLDLAAKIDQKIVDLDQLTQQEDEEVIAHLTQVKGIGRWTAQMYLIFSLGRPDILPVDDLGLRQALQRIYTLADLPKKRQFETIANPWKPYRTLACWYLWRSLDLDLKTIPLGDPADPVDHR